MFLTIVEATSRGLSFLTTRLLECCGHSHIRPCVRHDHRRDHFHFRGHHCDHCCDHRYDPVDRCVDRGDDHDFVVIM